MDSLHINNVMILGSNPILVNVNIFIIENSQIEHNC